MSFTTVAICGQIWGESGLSLASCQVLRNANFAVQCSLLLMLAARAARLLALWCHPSGMDGSSAPSLWQLLELSWVINNGSFCERTIDHCAFSIARRRWRMPITVICTNLPGFNDVVECHPSRFRCEGGHQHPRKKMIVTGDGAYIPSELSVRVARTLCLFGYWSVSPYLTCLFVLVRLRCLMTVSGSFSGPPICIFESF